MLAATLSVILVGGLSPGANVALPSLHVDYAHARTAASTSQKPIAVFIGRGSDTISRQLADGTISTEAARLLRDHYVYLYVDADTETGKHWAGQFALSEGLVISSPGGTVQAYRHAGRLGGAELTRQLTQYANAGQPTVTVTAGTAPVIIPASSPTVVPQYTIPGTITYPGFGSPGFSPYCAPGRH